MPEIEGASRTDDSGRTRRHLGRDLSQPNTMTVAVEPGNSNRVYLGTVRCTEVSNNKCENRTQARRVAA